MIKFQGEISDKNKKFFINKIKIMLFLSFFIPSLLILIPFIILVFIDSILYLSVVVFLILFPLIFLVIKNKYYEDMLPNEIIINDNTIICVGEKFRYEMEFTDISKIIDYGDCYKILFKIPCNNQSFICQKDLIVDGSIEEFEIIFKNKIRKKNK